jgi:CRISPR-associated protein Csm5
LKEEDLVEPFSRTIKEYGTRFHLEPFLKQYNLFDKAFIDKITQYTCKTDYTFRHDFRPFIRNAFSRPYIPGSSVKGVLRTALLYNLIKRMPAEQRQRFFDGFISHQLKLDPGNRGKKIYLKYNLFSKEQNRPLQTFLLGGKKGKMHNDIFRIWSVHDSDLFEKNELMVRHVQIFSARSNDSPKRFPVRVECLQENCEFDIKLSLNHALLKDFEQENKGKSNEWFVSWNDMKDLLLNPLDCIQEMTADVVAHEEQFFLREFNRSFFPDSPDMHLGWGGSLLTTSLVFLLSSDLRQEIRNKLFRNRGDTPAPKSRKCLQYEPQQGASPGWLQIMNTEE